MQGEGVVTIANATVVSTFHMHIQYQCMCRSHDIFTWYN